MNTLYKTLIPRFRSLPLVWRLLSADPGISRPVSILPTGILLLTFIAFLASSLSAHAASVTDPLEPVNRVTFGFNRAVDTVLVKPLAQSYDFIAPKPVKRGVRNFFGNLGELRNAANSVLQLRFGAAVNAEGRFAINSTLGLAGVFEVADPAFGLVRETQDFGRTLAHWGVGSGVYVVLPLIGPSTVRDAFGSGVDTFANPVVQLEETNVKDPAVALETTDTRAQFLPLDGAISGDKYLFVREMYLQYREQQIQGGSGNPELAFEEF